MGTVNFNGQTQRGPDEFPFLGVKGSGYGAPQGIAGSLLSCTRVQGIVLNHQ